MKRKIEKVMIIGRGAVGTVMGDILFESLGAGQFAFGADRQRAARYRQEGLAVNEEARQYPYASSPEDFGLADLILITTKYGALPQAIELAKYFADENTVFMSGINGIASESELRKAFPGNPVLPTIAQKMDACYRQGQVTYSQKGELVFGCDISGLEEAADRVEELFRRTGLPYIRSGRILTDQWSKLMANCGLNQVCAAFDVTYGQLMADPDLKNLYAAAMREVQSVANARGIPLTEQDVQDWLEATEKLEKSSMPSMRQDVLAKRPTELALFSGTIVPMALELGMDVPVLAMLYEKIKDIDEKLPG